MAKFEFRLQPLLNLKVQIENSLKNELGKATQKLEHEKNLLRLIEKEMEEQIGQIKSMHYSGTTVDTLKAYNNYLQHLKVKTELQKENINFARKDVDKYRELLIKAVQEREMFEKLKEKKYEEYVKDELDREQKLNDEIISYNYNKE